MTCVFLAHQNEFLEPHSPRDDVVPAVQPPGMTLTLKQYQLKTVGWMVQLEGDVDTAYLASRLVTWQGVSSVHTDPQMFLNVSEFEYVI